MLNFFKIKILKITLLSAFVLLLSNCKTDDNTLSGNFTDNLPSTTSPITLVHNFSQNHVPGGVAENLSWTSSLSAVDSLYLEYSDDDGSSWNSITTGLALGGNYNWTTPSINSTTVKVRLTAIAEGVTYTSITPSLTIDSDLPVKGADQTIPVVEDAIGVFTLNAGTDNYTANLLYRVVTPPPVGVLLNCGTGFGQKDCTYVPPANYDQPVVFTYQVEDKAGNVSLTTATVTLNYSQVNDPPVVNEFCNTSVNESTAYSCDPVAADPDTGASHTWSFGAGNTCGWASIDGPTGAITGNPTDNEVGSCNLVFKANDGTVDSAEVTVGVTVVNVQPTLTIADTSMNEDAGSTQVRTDAQVAASNEGFGVYSLDNATTTAPKCSDNGTVGIAAAIGGVSFNPDLNFDGACNIKVVFDDQNATNNLVSAEFTVTMIPQNDLPVITGTCSGTASDGAAYSCSPGVTDPDDSTFAWSFAAAHDCGAWVSIAAGTGAITGTPAPGDVGSCTLAFKVNDGTGDSTPYSVGVTVSGSSTKASFTQIAAGDSHTCGLSSDGNAYCWGYDAYGILGNGGAQVDVNIPVAVDTTNLNAGAKLTAPEIESIDGVP
ncbi:Ig-like domain-containing protein [bacterium]|nr:Ig-like domain-containing protein [bacterium]